MRHFDFIQSIISTLEKEVDLLNIPVFSASLKEDESIAVVLTPGGEKEMYYDETYEQVFSIQINARSKNELKIIDALNNICNYFDSVETEGIISSNDSFSTIEKETAQTTNLIGIQEDGLYIYGASFKIKLYIGG
ncbi:phage tail terminator protein [Bacillus cereus]|uniref:Minor capsid protein n=1 Tax=Bacillus cereus TaxID=1396 RepID=A0A9X7G9X3_BACCE|nr:minor capsid protein [Bacillus cereus]PED41966.1 minor capsid protein [Bacillus cereus]PFV11218.1 minor capsid protein [Bacillus cereus]